MYLLDTSVVSTLDPRRRKRAAELVGWLERNGASLYLSVMTIAEIEAGILKLEREGKQQRASELSALLEAIITGFEDRVLPMDVLTARHVARLGAATYRRPVELPDLIVAATAQRHGLIVLTRNLKHFNRLPVQAVDPFDRLPDDP